MKQLLILSIAMLLSVSAGAQITESPTSVSVNPSRVGRSTYSINADGSISTAVRTGGGTSSFTLSVGGLTTITGDARYPQLSGSYANPSWLTSLAFAKLTGTPTTISGYGITDGVSTGGSYINPSWLVSIPFSKLTSTPTTRAGYGITDAQATITTGTTAQYVKGDLSLGTLNTTAVVEGANLYYTDTRSRLAESATAPLVYNSSTGVSSIPPATTAVDGYMPATAVQLINTKASTATSIYRDNVATYAAMLAYTVPSGQTYLLQVATDETYSSPYNLNQWYLKDGSGIVFKMVLNREN